MKKPWMVVALAVCLALPLSPALGACGDGGGDIAGIWTDEAGLMQFEFTSDGALNVEYLGKKVSAVYAVEDGNLSVDAPGASGAVLSAMFQRIEYSADGGKLTLTNSEGETQILYRK